MCPEKLRTKPEGDNSTDATLVGTATHAAVEHWLEKEGDASLEDLKGIGSEVLDGGWDEVRVIQMNSKEEARFYMLNTIDSFWAKRLHFPFGGEIEKPFALVNLYHDERRTITITGTPDYYHHESKMIFDWKTNAQSYHRDFWKVERYAIQPTVYCMALNLVFDETPDFTFVRFPKDGGAAEMATVKRNETHFQAIVYQFISLAVLIESGLPTWPLRPTDWHCSPKWCDTFRAGGCLGAFLGGESYAAPWMDNTHDQLVAIGEDHE